VLGLADVDGRVRFLARPLPIPPEAVAVLTDDDMKGRVRLTGSCISTRCVHWEGECSLGRSLANLDTAVDRACPIVSDCRWYRENGNRACGVCTRVFHDLSRTELESNLELL
jgi:hypothetical protein